MTISESETSFFKRSIQLALEAGEEGNLPIGAVITLDGKIVSEGKNTIWYPQYNPNRHAEIEALRNVPGKLWKSSRDMTLYTTLEPCLMCVGAIILHHIGCVMYGSADDYGGASLVFGHTPTYFEDELSRIEWIGPAFAEECDKLFLRVMQLVMERREKES
jgi:tRNA(adenine34) deaminase